MNRSTASAQWISTGCYVGIYVPYWTSKPQRVTGTDGEPIRYRTAADAECAAWRALKAEEDRIEAIRFDPSQTRETPKQWQAVKPKSLAGKRAAAERLFKERAEV